ncbi:MAG TPA: hypothetical protein VJO53_00125 [Candidatus Acidoferrales bacterium]|nr:hypothetical protein [Candidatus Acidoferrales bacterium]
MRNVSSGTIYYYAEDLLGSSRTIVRKMQSVKRNSDSQRLI